MSTINHLPCRHKKGLPATSCLSSPPLLQWLLVERRKDTVRKRDVMTYLNKSKTTYCTHSPFTTSLPPAVVDLLLGASHPLPPPLPLIITACGRGRGRASYLYCSGGSHCAFCCHCHSMFFEMLASCSGRGHHQSCINLQNDDASLCVRHCLSKQG